MPSHSTTLLSSIVNCPSVESSQAFRIAFTFSSSSSRLGRRASLISFSESSSSSWARRSTALGRTTETDAFNLDINFSLSQERQQPLFHFEGRSRNHVLLRIAQPFVPEHLVVDLLEVLRRERYRNRAEISEHDLIARADVDTLDGFEVVFRIERSSQSELTGRKVARDATHSIPFVLPTR